MTTLSEHRRQQCVQMVQQTPFMQHLKAEIGRLDWGQCTLIMSVGPEHLQQHGFVHAGVQSSLADHACGAAAHSCLREQQQILSIEFKMNLLRPAQGASLKAVAEVIKAGRRVTVVQAQIYCGQDDNWVHSATMLATMAVIESAAGSSDEGQPSKIV